MRLRFLLSTFSSSAPVPSVIAFSAVTWLGLVLAGQAVFAQALVYPGTVTPSSASPAAAPAKAEATPPAALAAPASTPNSAVQTTPILPDAPGIQTALLLATNKVTARSTQIEAALGTTVRFGNLEIIAKRCQTEAPPARGDQGALLDVWELKPSERPAEIFYGWMFAATPSLSALQHPVYDITLLKCDRKTGLPDS